MNYSSNELAACKVVPILQQTWTANAKKELFKEIKVHSQLKHAHVLEFLGSETYEDNDDTSAKAVVPAVYMLLEMAAGGDLFDKIGSSHRQSVHDALSQPLRDVYSSLLVAPSASSSRRWRP